MVVAGFADKHLPFPLTHCVNLYVHTGFSGALSARHSPPFSVQKQGRSPGRHSAAAKAAQLAATNTPNKNCIVLLLMVKLEEAD
jgi:hypothetical protein